MSSRGSRRACVDHVESDQFQPRWRYLEAQWGLFPSSSLQPSHSLYLEENAPRPPWLRFMSVPVRLKCVLMKSLSSSLYAPQAGSAEDTPWGPTPRGILIRQLLRTQTTEQSIPSDHGWPVLKACQLPQPQWVVCFPRRAVPTSCPRRGSYKTPKGAKVRFRNSIAHLSLGALIYVPS